MATETSKTYTGSRALQLINGTTIIVARRSRLLLMLRVAMMLGMAQAKPPTSGMMLRPLSPNLRMILSVIKLARTI